MGRPNRPGGDVDDFLAHYGVKGMKWGVRRGDRPGAPTVDRESGSMKHPVARNSEGIVYPVNRKGQRISDDAARANLLKVAAKSGTETLSNKQLQDLVTRMNLEQQYSRLNPQTQSAGQQFAIAALRVAAPIAVGALAPKLGVYGPIAKTLTDAIAKKK